MANLSDTERWAILTQSGLSRAANDLAQKPAEKAAEITNEVGVGYMTEILAQLGTDAAADLLRNLPAEFGAQALDQLKPAKREHIREVLSYPAGTAGSMMAKEYLFVPDGMNIAEAIEYLHMLPQERKGRVPYVYVVDSEKRLAGVIDTQDLILNPLDRVVSEIMKRRVVSLPATASQKEVADTMQSYRYPAVPVVDAQRRLVGVISADNAIQAVKDQAEKDIAHIVGTGADEMKGASIPKIMKLRLPWLLFSVVSGLFCTFITEAFQHEGRTLAVLFVFIPVLLGLAESTGIQGATIVVRKLTFGNVSGKEIGALFLKEAVVGILVGVICGLIVGFVTSLWQGNPALGVAIAVSMQVTILISAVIGLVLPLVFRAFRVDPAAASGPLVLAVCDIQTLFVYFNLANFILTR